MPLDFNQLRELLSDLNQTDISELTLKDGDFELTVRRGTQSDTPIYTIAPSAPAGMVAVPPITVAPPLTPTDAVANSAQTAPPKNDRRLSEVISPMVGTFYRAPAPDEPPFVEVGDRIQVGQTVCIIEAMKLMNELESEISGEIVEILVQNGEPVEYGQTLMRVNPT